MSLLETIESARSFLERNGRVSLRVLKLEFELTDDQAEALVGELVDVQQVAALEGKVLTWIAPAAREAPASAGTRPVAGDGRAFPADRAPRDYTPKHLADRILRSKSALEGERKQVTVLFADVKSSMELSEDLDPEAWHRILERFFEILTEGVHRFEGTVNQYTGDGIMALFGAPVAHEDHAQRACYAALHLRDELRRYGDELRLERGLNVSVRMGLNSGEVVVGRIGDDLRMDYTARGHTVGVAQRMEQLAEPGRVYLTGATRELAAGYFELRDLGPTAVRGVRDRVRVYELEGVGELRSRFDLSRARGLSRFVGREDEMATLGAALERASAGEGQVIGVVGQAGTGKSRLCHEFLERCRASGVRVRHAECLPHGKTTPLLPVIELMRQTFEIDGRDSPGAARSKIAGTVVLIEREMEPDLPLVFDLLGVPDPDRPSPPLAPEDRQRRIQGLVRRLIQARSERDTGVLLIEDLHWMDGASEDFIAQVVQTVTRSRTLLLLNFRPEYGADWMQGTHYRQIPLRALGPEVSGELLGHLLGSDPSLEEVSRRIRERSGGNPFFIEELVRSLAEAGSLAGAPGAYRLVSDPTELELPSSVHAVLAARIDRLSEEQKRVLHAASVLGDRFNEPLLVEVAEAAVEEAVRDLMAAEFLYEEAIYPEREYAFVHPLTREVAYRTQLAERRAALHGAAARALSTRRPEAPGSHAALLAHHFDEAGDGLPAARWHAYAARWSGMNHPTQTLFHLQRVRELTDALDPSSEADELGAMARVQLILAGARIGAQAGEIRPLYEEGVERARRSGSRTALAWLLTAHGNYRHQTEGVVEAVLPDLEEAVRLAEASGERDLEITASYNLAIALVQSDPQRGAESLDGMIERLKRNPEVELALFPSALALLQFMKLIILCWLGRLDQAEQAQRELVRLATAQDSPVVQNQVLNGGAMLAYAKGDAEASLRLAARSLASLAEDSALPAQVITHMGLSQAHEVVGDHRAGLEAAEKALATIRGERVVINFEPSMLGQVALSRARCGDPEGGLALADEAISLSLERGSLLGEAHGRAARVLCLLLGRGAGAADEISAELDRAARVAERSGLRGVAAQLLERRAELARELGDAEGRRRWLGEAESAYREMGATERAERVARDRIS